MANILTSPIVGKTRHLIAKDLARTDSVVDMLDLGEYGGIRRLKGKVIYRGVYIQKAIDKIGVWRHSDIPGKDLIISYLKHTDKIVIIGRDNKEYGWIEE